MATGQAESMNYNDNQACNRYLLVKTMGGVACGDPEYGWCQNSDVQGGSCQIVAMSDNRAGSIELPKVVNDHEYGGPFIMKHFLLPVLLATLAISFFATVWKPSKQSTIQNNSKN
ncbi:hypothetical protein SPFM15_00088 [Salmonella phage SPFM15]|nr:hypothetical protein SPFM5_00083 [Salmonella phage SPFM5]VFR13712.1 hypothetical protein SPFM15_00088 [Salmonella phage SPFM15]